MHYRHFYILFVIAFLGCQPVISPDNQNSIASIEDDVDEEDFINKAKSYTYKYNNQLHQALVNDNHEAVEHYLQIGANPHSSLSYVVKDRNIETLQILLEYGADPNYRPSGRYDSPSMLMLASSKLPWPAEHPDPSPDMVKLLIEYGADINYETTHGNVISYLVCEWQMAFPPQEDEIQQKYTMIKYFIDKGASVNAYCKNGGTPLAYLYQFKYPSWSDSYMPEQQKRREENVENAESIMADIRDRNPIVGLIESAGGVEKGNPNGSWAQRNILMPIIAPFLGMH